MNLIAPVSRERARAYYSVWHRICVSSHTSLTLFLEISDWRSRTSLVLTWITILVNLRLALASTFKFAKMSGALAPGKQWTMVACVYVFTFRTIESPITRALSSGFSVGASLSVENLFNVLIGTERLLEDWQGSSIPDGGGKIIPQEWLTRMFWRVILSLSVMVPWGVAH